MARAHRITLIATITTVAYLLLFFNMLSVPLLDAKIAEQILPVVRISLTLYHLGRWYWIFSTHHSAHTQIPWIIIWNSQPVVVHRSRGGFWWHLARIVYGRLEWVWSLWKNVRKHIMNSLWWVSSLVCQVRHFSYLVHWFGVKASYPLDPPFLLHFWMSAPMSTLNKVCVLLLITVPSA